MNGSLVLRFFIVGSYNVRLGVRRLIRNEVWSIRLVQQQIIDKLTQAMQPDFLDVVNESAMHAVPENSETHFKVTIVAQSFVGVRPVARHQRIYQELAEELDGPVHALALHTYSPDEWVKHSAQVPTSPDCLGGSTRSS
jgi:BolA protein